MIWIENKQGICYSEKLQSVHNIQKELLGELGQNGWFTFTDTIATILTALAVLWIYPVTGYSNNFLHALEHVTPP